LSDRLHENNRITTLAIWVLVFILLFTLMSFALVQLEELFDYEDLSLVGGDLVSWTILSFSSKPLSLGLELGVFTTIMRLEYLRGHIGEKHFASHAVRTNNLSLFERLLKTALFYSAVFSIFSAFFADSGDKLTKIFRSKLFYPISFKGEFLIYGGF